MRFRFSAGLKMRLSCIAMLAVAVGLSGCAQSYGTAAHGFFQPQIGASYIALAGGNFFSHGAAAAVVIAPGIAVTNAHNRNIVDATSVIGASRDFDLLYFRTPKTATLPSGLPVAGEAVIAYGQDTDGNLRVAHGVVTLADGKLHGLAYQADAGPGFSGGPVLDAKTGVFLGVTFGYLDNPPGAKGRLMYAYDVDRIRIELAGIEAKTPQ
jgi:V8-like Glu-specific endopeptidase